MMGGNGISDEFGVARHLVNVESSPPTKARTTSTR
jgi:hypothetical protein